MAQGLQLTRNAWPCSQDRKMMKLLIAYDGSKCSDAALDDLVCAGLPPSCEALVISVAEVWLPPPNGHNKENANEIKLDAHTSKALQDRIDRDKMVVAEAATLANHAKKRLLGMFPNWQVASEATYGSPAREILAKADDFGAEMIVVGSHGRSAITRFFLGSISQKILTEARCTVRVARGKIQVDPAPARIVIGFDGSEGSLAAVRLVASRSWPDESKVRLVAGVEEIIPSAIGRFIPPIARMTDSVNDWERDWMTRLAKNPLNDLREKNISATLHLHPGNPKDILLEEAERWHADCIFVGANRVGISLESFLLGSTSSAVASRAHCSVEVVRKAETT
jgi:nucleotide-binding universal stress UspA family protein